MLIQNGLLRPVVITGHASSGLKLADEMAAMHVPGVSVAVIHGGKIEWARGFGVKSVGGLPEMNTNMLYDPQLTDRTSFLQHRYWLAQQRYGVALSACSDAIR